MRREEDHGLLAVGDLVDLLRRALHLQPCGHGLFGRMPEPAAVQPGLRHIDEGLARDAPALGRWLVREAQRQVGVDHAPARRGDGMQHVAQHGAEAAHHWQWHMGQGAHEDDAEA
jgi:hypothetical protein